MGFLFGFLIFGIFVGVAILFLPTAALYIHQRFIVARGKEQDGWLTSPTTSEGTIDKRRTYRSELKRLFLSTRKKKYSVSAVLVVLLVMTTWLGWEGASFGYYGNNITNEDMRVFAVSASDEENHILSVQGYHNPSLDVRECVIYGRLQSVTPDVEGHYNITASWNLTCTLSAGILSSAVVSVEYYLFSPSRNAIWSSTAYSLTAIGNSTTYDDIREESTWSIYRCQASTLYFIAVGLRVILSGSSSVTGLNGENSATLQVFNLNVSDIDTNWYG